MFDRALHRSGRIYRQTLAVDIENMSIENPTDFWRKIKNLGLLKDRSIPEKIVENNNIFKDENTVHKKWKVKNLFNSDDTSYFDEEHFTPKYINNCL